MQISVYFSGRALCSGAPSHRCLLFDEGGLDDPAVVPPPVVLLDRERGEQAEQTGLMREDANDPRASPDDLVMAFDGVGRAEFASDVIATEGIAGQRVVVGIGQPVGHARGIGAELGDEAADAALGFGVRGGTPGIPEADVEALHSRPC